MYNGWGRLAQINSTLTPIIPKSQAPDQTPQAPEVEANPHDVFSQMSQHMPHNRIGDAPQSQAKNQTTETDERPHDVFDRMGHNMSYANAFDLGSISMEQRFEAMDEAIDKEEQKIQARTNTNPAHKTNRDHTDDQEVSAPFALDDVALVDDLDQMHQAMDHEDEDEPDEDSESTSDYDESDQAIQFSTERARLIKPGGASIFGYQKDEHGLARAVSTGTKIATIPFGKEISVDSSATLTQNNRKYIWANDGGKTGYIRKNNVLPDSLKKLPQILANPRLKKALREIAKTKGSELELDFYLAVEKLEPNDQIGAVMIYDKYLHDEDYGTKAQDLNGQLRKLNPKVNANLLLKTDAEKDWRQTVNVGAARAAIQDNFPQLIHQNMFKKALFFQAFRNANELKSKLENKTFQFNPKITGINMAKLGSVSVMTESTNNLQGDVFRDGLKRTLALPGEHDRIKPWFNV